VVGGGPSGACAAHYLASDGIDVVRLEREILPRYKLCGGGLVCRVLQFLPTDAGTAVERQCAVAEVNLLPHGYHLVARRHEPALSMTMRARFDWISVDSARLAGARIVFPCEVLGISRCTDEARLDNTAGSLYARFVIAADGAAGRLARFAGFRDKRIMAPALEWDVIVPPRILGRFSRMARFDIGAVSNGYG
jgi:flavin-dependent dehydrogenase